MSQDMLRLSIRSRRRAHANPFTVRDPVAPVDWNAVYRRQAPLAVDIGCGKGQFLVQLAQAHPEWNVLGIEIRGYLVEACHRALAQAQLSHAHVVLANANLHLAELLPDASVAFISINFPDPWYKNRHHKRRIVQAPWLAHIRRKLLPGAQFHVMTDYKLIAEEIHQLFASQPDFIAQHPSRPWAPVSTTGLSSERELKHQARGEFIYRMAFVYQSLFKNGPS